VNLTPEEWHVQFSRQAGWTRSTRDYLYRQARLPRAKRVLDVGSGTGAVTEELASRTVGQVIGVDLAPEMVAYARRKASQVEYQLGDAHALPFDDGWFDISACHFVLMWCHDPARAAREMVRVTRPGGAVLVCAEPDYGGRIDYPELSLGRWQCDSLRREGADPCLGRKLHRLFALAAVRQVQVGLIPGIWGIDALRAEFSAEWALWEHSLRTVVPADELAQARAADWAAIETGQRLAFVPLFYALVRV